jgi:CheY-like chemotaxis protein
MSKFNFNRVTLVDDDMVVKILMVKILRNIGFIGAIHQFEDGEQALNEIQKLNYEDLSEGINLILLDINMPVMDGWGVLDGMKLLPTSWKNNQFITVITSSIDKTDKNRALSYPGVKDFIQKPVSIQLFKDFLKEHNLFEE